MAGVVVPPHFHAHRFPQPPGGSAAVGRPVLHLSAQRPPHYLSAAAAVATIPREAAWHSRIKIRRSITEPAALVASRHRNLPDPRSFGRASSLRRPEPA